MSTPNIGWTYYRKYYHELRQASDGEQRVKELNAQFVTTQASAYEAVIKRVHDNLRKCSSHVITATVVGRGFLSGTGIDHNLGYSGEYSFGFTFDHATGLPYLAGSSLKGALRAHLERQSVKQALFPKAADPDTEMRALIGEVFEGKNRITGSPLTIFEQCHFLGGFPTAHFSFEADVLTPHVHPLEKPNPLPFLKVAPGSDFKFYLNLSKRALDDILDGKLFQYLCILLERYGLGAKTNYDFGRWKILRKESVQILEEE